MKAKTKFIKMYYKLPKSARTELIFNFPINPMTLNVCYGEIFNNTKFGDKILKKLSYENDKLKELLKEKE